MKIDERTLNELIVESEDLQSDALHQMKGSHEELEHIREERRGVAVDPADVDAFNTARRDLMKKMGLGALAARGLIGGGFAAALASVVARPVSAADNIDVQILQTASSLEILAVATYGAALSLPIIANGNPVVKKFAETTMAQHDAHKGAFQKQTETLGGKMQTNPNPKYAPVVEAAKPTLTTPAKVVTLAATLEQVATETYLADLGMFKDSPSRKIMASVMGVESQHLATLRAVGALLAGGAAGAALIAIPTNPAKLPAAAGSIAFPDPFEGITMASPPAEGALQ